MATEARKRSEESKEHEAKHVAVCQLAYGSIGADDPLDDIDPVVEKQPPDVAKAAAALENVVPRARLLLSQQPRRCLPILSRQQALFVGEKIKFLSSACRRRFFGENKKGILHRIRITVCEVAHLCMCAWLNVCTCMCGACVFACTSYTK